MIALYPGTFDPITLGHEDLMRRAAWMFDKVIVAVSDNPAKSPMFSLDERIQLVEHVLKDLPNVEVIGYTGLTVKFAQRRACRTMIRGLRAVTDFEYEFQIASVNRNLAPDIETVFLPSKTEYTFISSSVVRELARYGGSVDDLVHPFVRLALLNKVAP